MNFNNVDKVMNVVMPIFIVTVTVFLVVVVTMFTAAAGDAFGLWDAPCSVDFEGCSR